MCGRYTITRVDGHGIAQRFGVHERAVERETLGRYNVCPTERVLAVCADGAAPEARGLRWGLVPPWARALGAGYEPINARVETVASKRPFAELVARPDRRCLVVADGWYEWLREERPRGTRTPFRYTVDGGEPFAFAGLWIGETCAIVTCEANALALPIHDRMPVVLGGPPAWEAWLDPGLDGAAASELLGPLPAEQLAVRPASPLVNSVANDGPECLDPAAPLDAQLQLSGT